MYQKSILIISIVLALTLKLSAQQNQSDLWSANVSFFSPNITHDGVKLGAERTFLFKEKTKKKRSGAERIIQKQTYHGFNLGYYHLPRTSNAFFMEATIGKRRIGAKNFIHGGELGLMFINSFNYGKTFTVNDNHEVSQVRGASNRYLAPKIHYEIGYQFKEQFIVSCKFGMFVQTGHFKSVLPFPTSELCLSYSFSK
jgi:hypothetical protein